MCYVELCYVRKSGCHGNVHYRAMLYLQLLLADSNVELVSHHSIRAAYSIAFLENEKKLSIVLL